MAAEQQPLVVEGQGTGRPAKEKKPMIYVSITAHSITAMDTQAQHFSAFFELDFMFNLKEIMGTVMPCFFDLDVTNWQTSDGEPLSTNKGTQRRMSEAINANVAPKDVKIPFILLNATRYEITRENHFFKVADKGGGKLPEGMSMYCDPEKVRTTAEPSDELIWKCEKYCITGAFKYFTKEFLYPFGDATFMIKIATDGRPGSEKLGMEVNRNDCSYPAFSRFVFGYTPYPDDKKPNAPMVLYDLPEIQQQYVDSKTYPRCYMLVPCSRSAIEDWLKFYAIPAVVCYYSFVYQFKDSDNFVGTVGTNLLAFIALLFTLPTSNTMIFAEMTVLIFCAVQVSAGIYMAYTGTVHGLLEEVCFGTLVTITVIQKAFASWTNYNVRKLIQAGRFDEVDAAYL